MLLILSVSSSCDTSYFDTEIDDFSWEGEIKTPLGYTSFTILDLLAELEVTDIDEDTDGTLIFSYTDTLKSNSNIVDITIPKINSSSKINTPIEIISALEDLGVESFQIPEGSPLIQDITAPIEKTLTTFFYDNMELTAADFSGGFLSIKLTSTIGTNSDVHISIVSLINKNTGLAYTNTVNLPENSSKTINIPLVNYNADFTYNENGANNTTNAILNEVTAIFYLREGDVITKTGTITYNAELNNASTNVIYGDFKNKVFSRDTEIFSFNAPYTEIENSAIDYTNSTLKLDIKNGFGFPIGLDVSSIKSYSDTDQSTLTYSGVQNQGNVHDSNNKIVIEGISTLTESPKTNTRIINNSNSNFADLLAIKPTSFELTLSGNLNPIELNSDENFYARVNKGIELAITVDIPLDVKFENVILEQEIVPFTIEQDISLVNNIRFDAFVTNNIPLSGTLNFEFFRDENRIDVSDSSLQFEAAPTDIEGKASGVTAKIYYLEFIDEDIEKLKEITSYKTSIILNTPHTDFVKLANTNYLELNISSLIGISTENNVTK